MLSDRVRHHHAPSPSLSPRDVVAPYFRKEAATIEVKKEDLNEARKKRREREERLLETLDEKLRAFDFIITKTDGTRYSEKITGEHVVSATIVEGLEAGLIWGTDQKGRNWVAHWSELSQFAKECVRASVGRRMLCDKRLG